MYKRQGTHHEAVKRGETHAGVDDLAVLDGGDGGTVADVAGDKLQILDVLAHELCNAVADIAVGGAVEAIAADLVPVSYTHLVTVLAEVALGSSLSY